MPNSYLHGGAFKIAKKLVPLAPLHLVKEIEAALLKAYATGREEERRLILQKKQKERLLRGTWIGEKKDA